MSTYETVVDDIITTDAKFQAYVQALEAAILASGFLEVAPDTGQINPLTVARPSISTYAGYRIYRSKDSMHPTKPVYVKMEYGIASVADRPALRKTSSTGTNGAGTPNGQVGSPIQVQANATGSGSLTVLGSGGDHDAWFVTMDTVQTSQNFFFQVGRLHDPADGSVGDPVVWDSMGSSSGLLAGSINWTDGLTAWLNVSNGLPVLLPDTSYSIHTGGNAALALIYQGIIYRNAKTWTIPEVVGRTSELPYTTPASSAFSLEIWGGFHTFLPMPQPFGNTGNRLCLLWE